MHFPGVSGASLTHDAWVSCIELSGLISMQVTESAFRAAQEGRCSKGGGKGL